MIILILIAIGVLVWYFEPKLDYTKNKKLLLWYTGTFKERKFIILW